MIQNWILTNQHFQKKKKNFNKVTIVVLNVNKIKFIHVFNRYQQFFQIFTYIKYTTFINNYFISAFNYINAKINNIKYVYKL